MYQIELLVLLTSLGATRTTRLLTGFGMLVLFTNLSLMEFQVRYLALFYLLSVIDGFLWFWMESLYKNIQCDQASDLWQQFELASELEFDLRETRLG